MAQTEKVNDIKSLKDALAGDSPRFDLAMLKEQQEQPEQQQSSGPLGGAGPSDGVGYNIVSWKTEWFGFLGWEGSIDVKITITGELVWVGIFAASGMLSCFSLGLSLIDRNATLYHWLTGKQRALAEAADNRITELEIVTGGIAVLGAIKQLDQHDLQKIKTYISNRIDQLNLQNA